MTIEPSFQNLIYFVVVILFLAFGYFIVRQFRNYSLLTKLVLGFLAVTIIPLAIISLLNDRNMRSAFTDGANQELSNAAKITAAQLDTFMNNNIETIRAASAIPYIGEFISSPDRPNQRDEITLTLRALSRQSPRINSVAILDIRGEIVADTLTINIGLNESDRDYFKRAIETNRPFASNVEFSQINRVGWIYFSAPVHDAAGKTIGVIRTRYEALVLQDIITSNNNLAGQGSFAQLVNGQYHIRLAHGTTSSINYRSVVPLDAATVSDLQAQLLLPPGTPEELSTNLPGFEVALVNYKTQPIFLTEFEVGENTPEQGAIVTTITQDWLVIYSQSQDVFLGPINSQARNNIVFAIVIGLAVVFLGFLIAQTLAGPIVRLTQTAEKVSAGDISAYAKVESLDEIGTLAGTFNNMTAQLREFIATLEQRVNVRTAELKATSEQNEKRARELQTISEIGRAISSEQGLEKLLPLITRVVSERFGFYHVGIFMLNETSEFAVLRAANSPGGQRMLERGHRLEIGHIGIVGKVASTGQPRIALNVGEDAVYFNNPDLPETHSEMALPMTVANKIIGVLDVQSTEPSAFTNEDVSTLSILADQIGIAIENARLLETTRRSLTESETVYRQYIQRQWTRFAQDEKLAGFRYDSSGAAPLETLVDLGEAGDIVRSGKIYQRDARDPDEVTRLAVPVQLRGEVVAVLDISAPNKQRWTDDDIDIIEAVAERVALSMENARLFQTTANRAERERVVSEISSKISGNIRMENILQTAAQELSQALSGSDVLIQLQMPKQPAEIEE